MNKRTILTILAITIILASVALIWQPWHTSASKDKDDVAATLTSYYEAARTNDHTTQSVIAAQVESTKNEFFGTTQSLIQEPGTSDAAVGGAIELLSRFDVPNKYDILAPVVQNSQLIADRNLALLGRIRAVELLPHSDPRTLPLLVQVAQDTTYDNNIRAEAAFQAGMIGGDDAYAVLVSLLDNESTHWLVRGRIVRGIELGNFTHEQQIAALTIAAADTDEVVSNMGKAALERLGT